VIAIDLGSNSFRAIEYDCKTKEFKREYEKFVQLALGLSQSQNILDEAVWRVVDAINEAKEILDFKNHKVVAVTTAAMRMAKNSSLVIKKIADETDVEFKIIDSVQEANYTLSAVLSRLKLLKYEFNTFVMIDIGGGSTEFVFYINGDVITKSFPIGIVTLTQKALSYKTFSDLLDSEMRDVREFILDIYKKHGKPSLFISTSGTPTTIASYIQNMDYKSYDKSKISGFELNIDQIQSVKNEFKKFSKDDLIRYVGSGREDFIFNGIEIFSSIYEILGFEKSVVIDDSLREGLAIDWCILEAAQT
jgi:exopolyphosphatase / guanosine-5'-triphosphate,3'-diphosphate pyrophosphatase